MQPLRSTQGRSCVDRIALRTLRVSRSCTRVRSFALSTDLIGGVWWGGEWRMCTFTQVSTLSKCVSTDLAVSLAPRYLPPTKSRFAMSLQTRSPNGRRLVREMTKRPRLQVGQDLSTAMSLQSRSPNGLHLKPGAGEHNYHFDFLLTV